MPTNKEFLYSLDPHELTEWFESEHFECPTDGGEASMMSVDAFIAEHTSNDTLGAKKVISGGGVNANDANAASLKDSSDITQNVTDDRETAETYNNSVADVTDSRDAKNSVTGAVVDDNDANVSEHVETANGTADGARAALDAKFAELTAKCYELQAEVDNLRSDLHAARSDAEYYRGKLGDVLDCVCEALRVGTPDASVVDRNGEVVG
ncbi:MAG: hypothetical protein IKP01_02110 [Bacteroidales bacterium]|nr:hypothetical protein [Bacteroidales bacterium]